jgi:hypothetical protein
MTEPVSSVKPTPAAVVTFTGLLVSHRWLTVYVVISRALHRRLARRTGAGDFLASSTPWKGGDRRPTWWRCSHGAVDRVSALAVRKAVGRDWLVSGLLGIPVIRKIHTVCAFDVRNPAEEVPQVAAIRFPDVPGHWLHERADQHSAGFCFPHRRVYSKTRIPNGFLLCQLQDVVPLSLGG